MTSVITTTNLKKYYGEIRAVDEVSLTVPKGSIYAFLGPNGAGKTTTIRLLLGLATADSGAIQLFGEPISGPLRSRASRIGSMVEGPSLYPHLTGEENLFIAAELFDVSKPRGRISSVLEMLDLTVARKRQVKTYSMGMKQRLGLAQALLHEPELLILDEPTNGLDPAGIQEMRALLRRLPEEHGITVFLSSHLLDEVKRVASHVGVIKQGRLIFEGSLRQMLSSSEPALEIRCSDSVRAEVLLQKAGFSCKQENGLLQVGNAIGDAAIAQINNLLVGDELDVYHLAMREADMESLFNKLTTGEEA